MHTIFEAIAAAGATTGVGGANAAQPIIIHGVEPTDCLPRSPNLQRNGTGPQTHSFLTINPQ